MALGLPVSGRAERPVPETVPSGRPACYPVLVADLTNDFSWSRSRDNVFQECRRRYYLHYYGSWGGWQAEGDPRARLLYVLKRLQHKESVGLAVGA